MPGGNPRSQVELRSTETRSTYNIVVDVEGMIDVHYASLTSLNMHHGQCQRMLQFHSQQFKHQQEAFEPVTQMQAVICCFPQWLRLEKRSFADNLQFVPTSNI